MYIGDYFINFVTELSGAIGFLYPWWKKDL